MNDITQFNIITLNNLVKLISPLDKIYAQKNIHLNNETIGKHVRHIIDFYLCFINGIKIKFIDYDKRERNKKVENDKEYAIKTISVIINLLKNSHLNTPITINLNLSITKSSLNSSIERELMYIVDHAIHHGHIIQLFIKNHYPNDYNNIEFYSPSTLDRAQCVK